MTAGYAQPYWAPDDDATAPRDPNWEPANCPAELLACRPGYACTRTAGHDGRHMAGTGAIIVAAWPGAERPDVEAAS